MEVAGAAGLIGFIILVLKGVSIIVAVDALSSWVVRDRDRFPRNITGLITAPLYRPIHAILDPQKMGGIDLSPMIVFFALQGIANAIQRGGF